VLVVAPWTGFWENNAFVVAWPAAADVLLSPWLRGALSAVGVVTIGAGLLDLLDLVMKPRSRRPESAGSAT
jgi:hypothetical protein